MARGAKTKKRRAARTGRTTLKNRTYQFYKPPRIDDDTVRAAWNPRKSPAQNLAAMGLQTAVNAALDGRAAHALSQDPGPRPDGSRAVELFEVPDSDARDAITRIPGKTFAQRKLPVSVDDQQYLRALLARHGDDYPAMARDIKTNDMQHTAARLRKMAARFYLLAPEHVRVDVPERVRRLMAFGGGGGGEEGGDGADARASGDDEEMEPAAAPPTTPAKKGKKKARKKGAPGAAVEGARRGAAEDAAAGTAGSRPAPSKSARKRASKREAKNHAP